MGEDDGEAALSPARPAPVPPFSYRRATSPRHRG